MRQFFTETNDRLSMSRLAMFINVLVAAFVTIQVVNAKAFTVDYMIFIFGLWFLAYGGKNAAKYMEQLKDLKGGRE